MGGAEGVLATDEFQDKTHRHSFQTLPESIFAIPVAQAHVRVILHCNSVGAVHSALLVFHAHVGGVRVLALAFIVVEKER